MKIFSGIRPSGNLHLGNYLGAMQQWIKLQNENDCVFCIVDLHAITTPYKPGELKKHILDTTAVYLAAGINPEKSVIFVQSQVKEHSELAWLLETITPMGELKRMTQFKEKSEQHKDYVNAGLLSYPVLMAADILLYKTDSVPVGKDQEQHIEFTRMIAKKFNQKFGDTFKEPASMILKEGAKIMSLTNPKKKMSKSDEPKSCIFLFDTPADITKKIMSAETDSGKEVIYNVTKKRGISNLLTIYSLLTGKTTADLEKEFKGKGYGDFKKSLAEVVVQYLEPFRRKQQEFATRESYLEEILKQGQSRAQIIAQATMQEVKQKMGLI
ncbi:tryptophan--tRNA ligase [Candidatus Parcubacteria bacterium]|nr:tryptophan--tRNA ligase [Candidatus Parcubacteria bacterium]